MTLVTRIKLLLSRIYIRANRYLNYHKRKNINFSLQFNKQQRIIDSKNFILTYHKIGHETPDEHGLNVTLDNFESHLKWLLSNYDILSIRELTDNIQNGTVGKRSIVLSFDDCYVGSFQRIVDLLNHYRVPGVFYVTTMRMSGGYPYLWNELLNKILFGVGNERRLTDLLNALGLKYKSIDIFSEKDLTATQGWTFHSLSDPHQRHQIARILRREFLLANSLIKLEKLYAICSGLECDEEAKLLTRKSIDSVKNNSLITIGGHTNSHLNLARLPADQQYEEICKNKIFLENVMGKPVEYFAFPYGSRDFFTSDTISILKSVGFKSAVTTEFGALDAGSELYLLPRIGIRNHEKLPEFL